MTVKMTFSLPDQCAERVRAAVSSGEAASASAYIAGLIAAAGEEDSWDTLMADWKAEHGSPTAEDIAWVEAEFARTDKEWDDIRRADS